MPKWALRGWLSFFARGHKQQHVAAAPLDALPVVSKEWLETVTWKTDRDIDIASALAGSSGFPREATGVLTLGLLVMDE